MSSKSPNSDLEEQVTCPVCKEIPHDGPVYQCCHGHLICRGCYESLQDHSHEKRCPTCRGAFVIAPDGKPQRSILAAGIIDSMVDMPCKNSSQGCLVVLKRAQLATHTEHCEFSPIPCINSGFGCQQQVPAKNLREHLKNFCQFRIVSCENAKQGCSTKGTPENMDNHEPICPQKMVKCPICNLGVIMEDLPWHLVIKHDAKIKNGITNVKMFDYIDGKFGQRTRACLISHDDFQHWFMGAISQRGCEFRASMTYLGPSKGLQQDLVASISINSSEGRSYWSGKVFAVDEDGWANGPYLTRPTNGELGYAHVCFSLEKAEARLNHHFQQKILLQDLVKRTEDLEDTTELLGQLKKISLSPDEKEFLNEMVTIGKSLKAAISLGADVSAKRKQSGRRSGWTGLQTTLRVVKESDPEDLEFLISEGADVDGRTPQGEAPLFLTYDPVSAAVLIKAGATVRVQDEKGQTRLHRAAEYEEVSLARLLLQQQPDMLNIRDGSGKTALGIAKEKTIQCMVDMLEARGATD